MWYLIVPPVIVVLCLTFLLWYLSRKGSDPAIAEKMSHLNGTEEKISFFRTREFFLRILEKMTQRFKVSSLRMHNALHDWSQSIKERRRKVQESAASQQPEKEAFPEQQEFPAENAVPADDLLEAPIVRSSRYGEASQKKAERTAAELRPAATIQPAESKSSDTERPMVSETAAQPEVRRKKSRNASREEALIARIAVNPKDFASYEELGDYYLEMENIKDAKECYRQVLKLSPVQRMVKIKIRRLEKILSSQKPE